LRLRQKASDMSSTALNTALAASKNESADFWFKLPTQSVATRRETNQPDRYFHTHDYIELVIVFNGTATHVTEGTRYTICSGDTFVIPPGIGHAYANTENLNLINILIRNQHLRTLEREFIGIPGYYALFQLEPKIRSLHDFKGQLRLSANEIAALDEWIALLETEANLPSHIACSRARAYLQLIIGNLCLHYEAIASVDSTKLVQIANCIRYMDTHLGRPLHLADLAHQAGMSERTLTRSFHASVGQSPIEYLLKMRLQRAQELLLASRASIAHIAFEVGFGDANYFTRQFRKTNGISPRDFRKKHRQPMG
jgi:AraC-like DNA-binding protein/mannose-6-phosphate isomerase-like protein (cupin superfamily)